MYNDARLVSFAEASGPIVETQYQARGLSPGSTYHVQIYSLVGGTYYAGGALPVTVTPESSRARILNPPGGAGCLLDHGHPALVPRHGCDRL